VSGSAAGFTCCPGSASCCTPRGGGWAGRCGSTLPPSTSPAMSGCSRWPRPLARPSCWRPARSCGSGGWTGPARCGRCGSCQAWQKGGSAWYEGAPCHRRRRGRGSGLRRVPRPARRRASPVPAMDTSALPLRARAAARQPAPAGARVPGRRSGLAHPAGTMRGVRRAWPAAREMFAEGRAPKTSLNRPIGQDRTLAVVRSRLDVVKGAAHTPPCDGERCPAHRGRRPPADTVRQPRRTRR